MRRFRALTEGCLALTEECLALTEGCLALPALPVLWAAADLLGEVFLDLWDSPFGRF